MIEEILMNYGTDELRSFVPSSAIKFISSMLNKQHNDCLELPKDDLVKIVASNFLPEIIKSKNGIASLVNRMSKEQIIRLNPAFDRVEVDGRAYEAVINWAIKNTEDFCNKIGASSVVNEAHADDSCFQGIKSISPKYGVYPYQKKISDQVLSGFKQSESKILVHLPTGAGKTRTAMNIACEHLRENNAGLVLWLADREELCTQAYEEFEKAWGSLGHKEISAYGIYSESYESISGIHNGFVVAGLQKLGFLKKKKPLLYQNLQARVTLIIFDEAHKAIAATYSEIVKDFLGDVSSDTKLLGLTATPGRNFKVGDKGISEDNKALAEFFGNNKIGMNVPGYLSPIEFLVQNEYLAAQEFVPLNYDNSEISAFELQQLGADSNETCKILSENQKRNKVLINAIQKEVNNGAQIIVFAATVEHARNIAFALSLLKIPAASITSNYDDAHTRRRKIEMYKNRKLRVLTNFNVLTAGFDAPATNVAIIARPTSSLVSYLQMAGRAMRGYKSGGNKICRIYTLMDDIPEFANVCLAFEHWDNNWREV